MSPAGAGDAAGDAAAEVARAARRWWPRLLPELDAAYALRWESDGPPSPLVAAATARSDLAVDESQARRAEAALRDDGWEVDRADPDADGRWRLVARSGSLFVSLLSYADTPVTLLTVRHSPVEIADGQTLVDAGDQPLP